MKGKAMAGLSISRVWDESRAVLARDGKLMFTVALALMALPAAIAELIYPSGSSGAQNLGAAGLTLIVAVIGLIGQLAIARLAVGPSLTVGEAIGHGARRTLPYLLSVILLFLGFVILALPFIGVMMAMGMDFEPPVETVPPGAWLIILALSFVILAVAVRLLLAAPVASLEGLGPVAILRRSWQLSAGHFWRLFGFLILFLIAAIVVLGVVSMIAGLFAAMAGQTEPFSVSALIIALLTSVASAAVTTVFVVMLTRMYMQLAGRDAEIEEVSR